MKRFYFAAFAALALVTGCQKNEVIVENPTLNAPIEFGTYLGKAPQTKAAELTDATLANFGVFASYTQDKDWNNNAPNFMYDQLVTKNGSAWNYNPIKYWPATQKEAQKISFFAYAPYYSDATNQTKAITLSSTNTDAKAPVVKFTINTDYSKMVDFTAAVAMNKSKTVNGEVNAPADANEVKFVLKHELTRVAFQAKLDRDAFGADAANKTKVNITDVKFEAGEELATSALYTFATQNDVDTDDDFRGKWSDFEYATDKDIELKSLLKATAASGFGDYKEVGVLLPDTKPVQLFGDNQYLFLIPTNGTTGLKSEDVVNVTFTYDIVTYDDALNGDYVSSTATKTVSLPAGSLKQGVAYKYTFTFGLHEVVVSATVDSWSNEDSGDNTEVDWKDTDVTAQP